MQKLFSLLVILLTGCCQLIATPSSVFWTVCTTDVYDTGTGHIDDDNYFTVLNQSGDHLSFPTEVGFELGVFSWKKIKVEAGVDYLAAENDPFYFNIGAAITENTLFNQSPAVKIGFFNAGTRYSKYHKTNQNIVDVIIGKTLPDWIGGKLCIGGFSGSKTIGKNRQGFMISYQKGFCKTLHCDGQEYDRWVFVADYASGKNTIGGGGFGLYYYFTPDISILNGPVWFNSTKINGRWKWSLQIDISFSVFKTKKDCF